MRELGWRSPDESGSRPSRANYWNEHDAPVAVYHLVLRLARTMAEIYAAAPGELVVEVVTCGCQDP